MSLPARVGASIRRHELLPHGGRVVVALSGGADSVALTHLLRDLEPGGTLVVAGLAHFNHQLRGSAAEQDEAFCVEMAERLRLALEVGRADVRAAAAAGKRSIEDAARRLRYGFLERAADRLGADAIAVGHSLDDQAETFLLRLVRGSGTRGLGGIRPRAGRVIRPLIDVRREELRQYVGERGLAFREDESNADVSIARNRIRHELIPYLRQAFSPRIAEVLARETAVARMDDDRLESEAIESAATIVLTHTPASMVLDAEALSGLHPAIASRVARQALERMSGGAFVGFEHVAVLLEFARNGRPGGALSLPGHRARIVQTVMPVPGDADKKTIQRRVVELGPEPGRHLEQVTCGVRLPLPIPGEVRTSEWSVTAGAENAHGLEVPAVPSGREELAVARVTGVGAPLAVRFRKPGDRFAPPGMGGRSKKLQDYLVDRKVLRAERDRLPLVVDERDRIVWVVGHGVAEGHRARAASPGVILLKARRLGGEV